MIRNILLGLAALVLAGVGILAWPAIHGAMLPSAEEPAPSRTTLPATPDAWRTLAGADLEAVRAALRDNTPIPLDDINPAHRAWLETGFAEAQARLPQVADYPGYVYLLQAYVNGFGDPHIDISATADRLPARWPGFIASAREDGAVVVWRDDSDPSAPPLGAALLDCDGRPLADWLTASVYPFVLNQKLAMDRRRAVPRLFLDRGNPFAPRPDVCRIEAGDQTSAAPLNWRDLPNPADAYWSAYADAGAGGRADWSVTEPAPGVVWIGVPTFSSGDVTSPRLDALIADVAARGDALRQGRAIVIDTRGNGGGNSEWSDRLAEAIFTPDVLDANAVDGGKSIVDWRASKANARFWRSWARRSAKDFGAWSFQALSSYYLAGVLDLNAGKKRPIWREGFGEPSSGGGLTRLRPSSKRSPFPARVYFLSNGSCGSSCLNFADRVLMVPGVRLIGSDTSGDSSYMEVRGELLPSGLMELTLPQKVYRGMGRGLLEAYPADLPYSGSWDDASVRAWVMQLIETDSGR